MKRMLKPKNTFSIFFLIFITFIFIFQVLIPIYKHFNPPSTVSQFTKEKALEDYDFLWETLEARYPYFGVVERKLEIDVEEVKNKYRKQLEARNQMEIEYFNRIISQAIDEMNYIGHLAVFDANNFFTIKDALDLEPEAIDGNALMSQVKALEDEKALESYGYMRNEFPLRIFKKILSENANSRISTSSPDENIAFLEIFQPSVKNQEKDLQYLLNYYKELEEQGVEHLIIRCHSSNDSGDSYWVNNIVAPNIDEVKTYKTRFFIKEDDWVKNYYESFGDDIIEQIDYEKFPNLNVKDSQEFAGYIEHEISIKPLFDKKAFSGQIYLLTDSTTFSSVEAFAQFAKGTGFATLVGDVTGGDGHNGGTPMMTNLPNSGLVFFYRMGYGVNEDGSSNVEFGTRPDVAAEKSETPMEACLRWINEKKWEVGK